MTLEVSATSVDDALPEVTDAIATQLGDRRALTSVVRAIGKGVRSTQHATSP